MPRQAIPQFRAHGEHVNEQLLYLPRVGLGQIVGLAHIRLQVIQLKSRLPAVVVLARLTIGAHSALPHGAIAVGQVQLPAPAAHGLQLIVAVVEEEWTLWQDTIPAQGAPHVDPVDGLLSKRLPQAPGPGGQDIDGHERRLTHAAGRELAGPAPDTWHAHSPFKRGALALAQGAGGARVVSVGQPGTVVGGVHHQGALRIARAFERFDDGPDRGVDLLDHVSIQALFTLATVRLGRMEGNVGHRVRQVEEERLVRMALDEIHRPRCEVPGEAILVGVEPHHLTPLQGRQVAPGLGVHRVEGPHVVGVGDAIELVKAVAHG